MPNFLSSRHKPLRWLAMLFFALLAAAPTAQAQWAEAIPGTIRLSKTVVDPAGNVTVAGEFEGTITIGNTTLTSNGWSDLFVARRSAAGTWEWAVSVGGMVYEEVHSLELLPSGDVVVAGQCAMSSFYPPSIAFGATTLTMHQGRGQGYVAKLTTNGQWEWAVGLDAIGATTLDKVVFDSASGDLLVSGAYSGTDVTIGPLNLPGNSAGLFAGCLSASGQWRWVEPVSSSGISLIGGTMSSDGNGGMVVSGLTTTPITLGAFTLNQTGANALFVARLTAGRTWQWAQVINPLGAVSINDQTVDANGNTYLTGFFWDTTLVGSTPMASAGGYDVFVAKLDSQGQWQWVQQLGGPLEDRGNSVCVDNAGSVYVGGTFNASTTVGFPLINAGHDDGMVLRLSTNGTQQAAVAFGGPDYDFVLSLALSPSSGQLVMGGGFNSPTLTIGPTRTLIGSSSGTGFVANISSLLRPLGTAEDAGALTQLTLSPNPAHGALWLNLPATTAPTTATLLDGVGRAVRSFPLTGERTRLDIQGLAPGVYTVRVGAQTRRLVVE